MAPKTVRFSAEQTVVHHIPSTPSPSHSNSTLPDSPGPVSPPNPFSPLAGSPLQTDDATLRMDDIHSVLRLRSRPGFNFDVSKDPAQNSSLSEELSEEMRAEPATVPPLPYVTLVSRCLPWAIEVQSSSTGEGAFVSVADLLGGLHCALRIRVTDAEFELQNNKEEITAAFEDRCKRVAVEEGESAAEVERAKGLMRVDFLRSRLRFLGLSAVRPGYNILKFSVIR
ncbi:hypothetical protein V5O48_009482 [Marasmius crinis-equi]|uniref:DUF6699 domain-containing protein n=1 Tax=Marasmius crinis-equi TaxID=585013 RepID=A0ABR3FAY9_9AGAR